MAEQEVDALLVTDLVSVRWMTGFSGSNGVVLVAEDELELVTDGRYADQAPAQVEAAGVDAKVTVTNDHVPHVASRLGGRQLAVEADHLSWAAHRRLSEAVERDVVALSGSLVELRAVKDAGEIDRIRRAASIADAALRSVVAGGIEGATEREVASELDRGMRDRGATSSAYETIVASGPNAALPHARPGDRVIRGGDLVIIDVGALFDGYRSDMTRTFFVDEPSSTQLEWLDAVARSQRAGVAALRPGVEARGVDAACREVLEDAGLGERFTHGAGHGVGLDIHERPRVNPRSDDIVIENMLVTVEPGVYVAGEGGVRWEDLHLVTGRGSAAGAAGSGAQPPDLW